MQIRWQTDPIWFSYMDTYDSVTRTCLAQVAPHTLHNNATCKMVKKVHILNKLGHFFFLSVFHFSVISENLLSILKRKHKDPKEKGCYLSEKQNSKKKDQLQGNEKKFRGKWQDLVLFSQEYVKRWFFSSGKPG